MSRLAHRPKHLLAAVLLAAACGPSGPTGSNLTVAGDDQVLLVAMAEFGRNDDGSPAPLPARLGILTRDGDTWSYESIEDPDSNVFHKAMAYRDTTGGSTTEGILTLGGTGAVVKLWSADGMLEIYATPTEPNRLDGSAQPGSVVRYVPAAGEGRTVVADLGSRHAKEILVTDLDGDGRDELYVSVEAVSGGKVQIRRYLADTAPDGGEVVATLDDRLCRFLTVGDVDGDGTREMVAATYRGGIWLLRPSSGSWEPELITDDSSSFEHAAILLDLDGDGRDELYVASDNQHQLRRYDWSSEGWSHEVLVQYPEGTPRLTWNLTPAPRALAPHRP